MEIKIPKLSMVVLIGASGCGKSTFARKHFLSTEILSSDYCRGLVSDNENDLTVTAQAFEILHFIAAKRLAQGKLTVIDATNVQTEARKPLIELARTYHCLPVAIVLNLPEKVCIERNKTRPDRNFGSRVVQQHADQLRRSMRNLKKEGFRHIFVLTSQDEVDSVIVKREPLWNDKSDCHGPFDIIGDVHGCYDELLALLQQLGYETSIGQEGLVYIHPGGRTAVFLGDLVDRGPKVVETLKLAMNMVANGQALCVPGNHDMKLMRKLKGNDVEIKHGLEESLAQIEALTEDEREAFKQKTVTFLDGLISHYVLDDRKLVVAHAGLKAEMQGRGSAKVRDFCLYGETTGETNEFGLPERCDWAQDYRGKAMVVYGHTPVAVPGWFNHTINIDTGCVFGGSLTALRYPEKELVAVLAADTYCTPECPPIKENVSPLSSQQAYDDLLDAQDVIGKRFISTRLSGNITIREDNATAALEVMSRFAANPKWLIYLPPTMSPCETSHLNGYLEHPAEAFDYFHTRGLTRAMCEEKHMGSRAVVVVCRDEETARKRFGVSGEGIGIVYTRTGRRFFDDKTLEQSFLSRLGKALGKANFWEEFATDWACFDCELMPWSVKAKDLLKTQYAAVGTAASTALQETLQLMQQTLNRKDLENNFIAQPGTQSSEFDLVGTAAKYSERRWMIESFKTAYRRYCWEVTGINGLKLAPFHLLATEGKVHFDKDHSWHLETIAKVCRQDEELLLATSHFAVNLEDKESVKLGTAWWEEITDRGAEGMVVKPYDFIATGKKGLVQPALKCRAQEYLRIIYGPEYTLPENLSRLRNRGLRAKRSLALREFALGLEGLERFCRREPLRHIHECVFGVLALESEPVDPRL